jgi:membrane fusion protein (multidrug efflux system)
MADQIDVAETRRQDTGQRTTAETRPGQLHDDEQQRQSPAPPGRGGNDAAARGKPRRSYRVWIILAVLLLIAGAGGAYYMISTAGLESTDDAYTDGFVVSIAPQVSGQVIELAVRDNQFVHAGDVLFRIDPRPFVAERDQDVANLVNARGQLAAAQFAADVARKNFPAVLAASEADVVAAQAQVAAAQATLFKAQTDARRQHSLPRAATTQQEVDYADAALRQAEAQVQQAQAQVKQAQARQAQAEPVKQNIGETDARVTQLDGGVKQAEAALERATLNLDWAVVRAPQDGYVTQRTVSMGNYVQAGTSVMSLVTPQVWVTANFKETQLTHMRPGDKATFELDAYPNMHLTGHVDSVQLGSGSRFSAFPAENATGNFVKIVQRVPVKLVIDSGLDPNLPLPIGISVTPTVTVH